MALGYLGLTISEYEGISLNALFNKLEGIERKNRESWIKTRFAAYWSVVAHAKNIKKPTDLIKFEWEIDRPRVWTERDEYVSNKMDGTR